MVRILLLRTRNLVRRSLELTEAKPLTVGVVVSGGLGISADAVAQVWNDERFNLRRNIAFGIHGFLYIGVVQYVLWCKIFP